MNFPKNIAVFMGIAPLVLSLFACTQQKPSVIKSLDDSSPARRYLTEFRSYRFPEAPVNTSPDGSAQVLVESSGRLPINLFKTCHTLSVVRDSAAPELIIRARESEPSSGLSFGWGWSKDSKAVFVNGSHLGIDCGDKMRGEIRLIYTLEDRTAWSVQSR